MTPRGLIMVMIGLLMSTNHVFGQMSSTRGSSTNTCVLCHAGHEEERISKPVDQWRGSVHPAAGIACQDCHGGSPTTMLKTAAHDPEAGYIGQPEPEEIHTVCGTCHQLQLKNYLPSPHGIEGEFWPTCTDCHSNHRVVPPRVSVIATADNCDDCHDNQTLDQFITVVTKALVPISDAREKVEALRSTGVPIDHITAQIDQAKNEYSNNASHVFTLDTVTPEVDGLRENFDRINKDIRAASEEAATRKRFGILIAVLLVMMAGIVWLYRKTLPEE